MTESQREDRILAFLAIGFVLTVLLGLAYAVWLETATPTITQAGPNCVIIQRGFQKDVRCFANVDVNTEVR